MKGRQRLETRKFFQLIEKTIEKKDDRYFISSELVKKIYIESNGCTKNLYQNIWKVLTRWGIYSNPCTQAEGKPREGYFFSKEELRKVHVIANNSAAMPRRTEILKLLKEEEEIERGIEMTIQSPTEITKEKIDKLLGGKIIQQKGHLYKVKVPKEEELRVFSLWLNSEINEIGITVMIDIELENRFKNIISQF